MNETTSIQKHICDSNVARTVEYDHEAQTMTIDFAKGEAAPKLYRYLEVPVHHFHGILAEAEKKAAGDLEASEGRYIRAHISGGFKDPVIPYAWELLDETGNAIARNTKPVREATLADEPVPVALGAQEAL